MLEFLIVVLVGLGLTLAFLSIGNKFLDKKIKSRQKAIDEAYFTDLRHEQRSDKPSV